jgi:hypothetical protein
MGRVGNAAHSKRISKRYFRSAATGFFFTFFWSLHRGFVLDF